jgi:E3 ubiquitin-protein ligase UBR1
MRRNVNGKVCKVGGVYQHLEKHGEKVGIFINIRKCYVLFAHGPGQGGFHQAPYLDKHGEPDPTLRRHHQLYLNQRRYDKLFREVWLNHLIPTVIARKLEGDHNYGGWETL